MATYTLSENNSGGSFWLSRAEYDRLFEAGWYLDEQEVERHKSASFLGDDFGADDRRGGTVPYSWRHSLKFDADSIREAVESFESATGQDFFAEGCNCCGAPFGLSTDDYSEHLSGDSVQREVIRPW